MHKKKCDTVHCQRQRESLNYLAIRMYSRVRMISDSMVAKWQTAVRDIYKQESSECSTSTLEFDILLA
eukprot:1175765-Amphidinium_carterae.1